MDCGSDWNVVPPESGTAPPSRAHQKNKSLSKCDNLFTFAFIVEALVIRMANRTTGCEHCNAVVARMVAASLAAGETQFRTNVT